MAFSSRNAAGPARRITNVVLAATLAFMGVSEFSPASFAATPQPGYPVPQIVGPTNPTAAAPGDSGFTLKVFGANFISGSIVNWNKQARATTFVSGHELDAQVLASDIASNTAGTITVTTNSPNGPLVSSTCAQVEVHAPTASFGATKSFPIAVGAIEVTVVGDVNGDGVLDVMSSPSLAGYLPIQSFFGNGDGTFSPGPEAVFNYPGGEAVLADFNGDGKLDLIAVSSSFYGGTPNYLQVDLGNGDGTFTTVSRLASGISSDQILAVGDFNRGGILDVALGTPQGTVSIYFGNGDGSFRKGSSVRMGYTNSRQVVAGDVNGDGILDLMSVAEGKDSTIQIRLALGNGDGTFQASRTIATSPSILSLNTLHESDFNGDGKLDLYYSTGTQAAVLLGRGDGTFKPPCILHTT